MDWKSKIDSFFGFLVLNKMVCHLQAAIFPVIDTSIFDFLLGIPIATILIYIYRLYIGIILIRLPYVFGEREIIENLIAEQEVDSVERNLKDAGIGAWGIGTWGPGVRYI
jgi:hypothetical protein